MARTPGEQRQRPPIAGATSLVVILHTLEKTFKRFGDHFWTLEDHEVVVFHDDELALRNDAVML